MKNSFLYTVVFTFILCFFFVLILSFTNALTIDTIATNTISTQQRAILTSLGSSDTDVDTIEKVKQKFTDVQEVVKGNNTYFKANFTGVPAFAKQFNGPGLWGVITGYIAFSEDLTRVIGFEVTDQNETPGLGGRITEQWFIQQFRNEKIVDNRIIVGKPGTGDENKDNGSIDGISGATRTSDGIQEILDKEIALFIRDLK